MEKSQKRLAKNTNYTVFVNATSIKKIIISQSFTAVPHRGGQRCIGMLSFNFPITFIHLDEPATFADLI